MCVGCWFTRVMGVVFLLLRCAEHFTALGYIKTKHKTKSILYAVLEPEKEEEKTRGSASFFVHDLLCCVDDDARFLLLCGFQMCLLMF